MSHALNRHRSIRPRDILRWWPMLLAAMGLAVLAAVWAHDRTASSFSATVKLLVVPLPQWDETFLGTDLVRDSGDATRTATTVASQLKSEQFAVAAANYLLGGWTPESVAKSVTVSAPGQANIVEITGHAADSATATRLASGYATAVIADRWQTISVQVDERMSLLAGDTLTIGGEQQGSNPAAAEHASRLRTLAIIRDSKADPTLRVSSTGAAVPDRQMSLPVTLILAALGGLSVGAVAAAALTALKRNVSRPPVESNSASPNGTRTTPGKALNERKRVDAQQR